MLCVFITIMFSDKLLIGNFCNIAVFITEATLNLFLKKKDCLVSIDFLQVDYQITFLTYVQVPANVAE